MAGSSSNWFKVAGGPLKGTRVFVSNAALTGELNSLGKSKSKSKPTSVRQLKQLFATSTAHGQIVAGLAAKSTQPKGQAQKGGAIQKRLSLRSAPVVNGESLSTMPRLTMVKHANAVVAALPTKFKDQLQADYKAKLEGWMKTNPPPLDQGATSHKVTGKTSNEKWIAKLKKADTGFQTEIIQAIFDRYHQG